MSTPATAGTPWRVAVLTSSYPAAAGDPAGNFVAAEVDELLAAGSTVTVVGPEPLGVALTQGARAIPLPHGPGGSSGGAAAADDRLFGWPGAHARVRERPGRLRGLPVFVAGAARALARLDPDEVHAHWLFPAGLVALHAAPRRASLTLVGHGTDLRLLARAPAALRAAFFAAVLLRGARLRVVAPVQRAELLALTPRAQRDGVAAQLEVRPATLALGRALGARRAAENAAADARDERELRAARRAHARAALGIAPDAPLVLVVGRLVAEKRIDTALHAALTAGLPPTALVVLGDGPLHAALRSAYPGVRFGGLTPHARTLAWMAAADVLVSASLHEGAPTAVREALALGVPVAARRWERPTTELAGAPPAGLSLADSDAALAAGIAALRPPR